MSRFFASPPFAPSNPRLPRHFTIVHNGQGAHRPREAQSNAMNSKVTQLLVAARDGDDGAFKALVEAVQSELRTLAAQHLARERKDHTLQATALVNEAYLKLIDQRERQWEDRHHFLAIASTAMRRVLLESARAKLSDKRGGGRKGVTLFEVESAMEEEPEVLVALSEALDDFARIDPEGAKVVEMRWFGGLPATEIGEILGVSSRTVERHWRAARAWLRERLS